MSLAVTTQAGRPGAPGLRARLGELVFAGLALALGVYTFIGALSIPTPVGVRVGPTVFPIFVSVVLVGASLAVLVGVLLGHLGAPEEGEDIDLSHRTDWLTVAKIVVLVLVHMALIGVVGWALAAAVLFTGVAWALGTTRVWVAAIIGITLALTIQVVFGVLLGLSLPVGPVGSWLGIG